MNDTPFKNTLIAGAVSAAAYTVAFPDTPLISMAMGFGLGSLLVGVFETLMYVAPPQTENAGTRADASNDAWANVKGWVINVVPLGDGRYRAWHNNIFRYATTNEIANWRANGATINTLTAK